METIQAYLSEVKDFRIEKKCLHKLSGILLTGLFTYLSSGEDYEDMVLFARTHKEFLHPYVSLPNGIPSHDTFRRVFSMLEPEV
ncbi:MAG: transposase family protein [Tannerella sp.]|nr:transposase family protein [Tannerella sp.]